MISMIHDIFIKAKREGKMIDESLKQMPLMILSPDDESHYVALDIAIMEQRPKNFEILVNLVKEFDEVSSSKIMFNSFSKMMSIGASEVLKYLN